MHLENQKTKTQSARGGFEGSSIAILTTQAYSITNFRGPLIRALLETGLKVYALAPDYDEVERKKVEALGAIAVDINLSRTGLNMFVDIKNLFDLKRRLKKIQPDFVFNYFAKAVIYGGIAAKLAGVNHRFALVPGLGYAFPNEVHHLSIKRRMLRFIATQLYRLSFKFYEAIIFQNPDDVRELQEEKALPEGRVRIIKGTGVNLRHFDFQGNIPQQPITFLLMCRLLEEKGVYEYVRAAKIIKAKYPDTRFIVLGNTDSNPSSIGELEVKKWVNENIIEWPGSVEDVRPWIKQTSVYVLPSYREGVPRSTQEAMAMGRAVITTNSIGCRETVDDGVNGFLVPVRDSEGLAAAMERFILEPELIKKMGLESRRIAEERFNVHKINQQILEAMGLSHHNE